MKLTLQIAKEVLRAAGMIITRTPYDEYRVNFAHGKEISAYYTTDLKDAIGTGQEMARRAGVKSVSNPRRRNPGISDKTFPRWSVLGRRFNNGTEAIWFAKQKALDSGKDVDVRQQDDGWSPSFTLQTVQAKGVRPAYDLSRNPRRYGRNPATCPACGGPGGELGSLGMLKWYRCRDCGMDFNKRARARWRKKKAVKKNRGRLYGRRRR